MTWEMAAACCAILDLAAAENTVYKSMLAKTSYIANCFYSAARVRRSHRQGRAGCYPVMLILIIVDKFCLSVIPYNNRHYFFLSSD